MAKILGIDTGGTYTDGVIIETNTNRILTKTKTLTTRHNLLYCIQNCIGEFSEEDLKEVSLICLSTTLATNALVEGRGCKEGLILIGGKPEGKMPTDFYEIIHGKLDIMGRLIEQLDISEVDCAIERFRGKVDALAVSGYASVRNPEHEIAVKKRIQEELNIPVVCAHELTGSLGFYDRTVTAVLNAKLIPMICDLIHSVKKVMAQKNINVPLMIVKGDGTLMTDTCAQDRPIETILSGPAASIIGGVFLSGIKDAIVLDMGGTTTDIANVTDGKMHIRSEGAKVGGWFTRIKASEVYTVGLGGDSRIFLDSGRTIHIGPHKALPFCVVGKWFPALIDEVRQIYQDSEKPFLCFWHNESEAYLLTRQYKKAGYSVDEQTLLESVRYKPHTLYWLQKALSIRSIPAKLDKLVADGILSRISLTPTDILHYSGAYNAWNAEISKIMLKLMSAQIETNAEDLVARIQHQILRQVSSACIQGSFYYDHKSFEMASDDAANYFVNEIFFEDKSSVLGGKWYLKKPIVAIGAPIKAWISGVDKTLQTNVIVPENAEVANAVGAAVAQATNRVDILIRPDPVTHTFTLFSESCRRTFDTLQEATDAAFSIGKELVASHLSTKTCEYSFHDEDVFFENAFESDKTFVERHIQVMGIAYQYPQT